MTAADPMQIATRDGVDKIAFTGSVRSGRAVAAQCADRPAGAMAAARAATRDRILAE